MSGPQPAQPQRATPDLRRVGYGHRVIRADAAGRSPDSLGTVIALDPYPDRDAIVKVGFENGTARWLHRDRLRRLGDSYCPTALEDWQQSAAAKAGRHASHGERAT